jgi:hypothetical protein
MDDGSGVTYFDPGLAVALRQARRFDLVFAHWNMYDDYVPDMLSENPKLRLFVYLNGMFSPNSHYPSSWYARDHAHHKIRWPEFGTYLMDPTSAGWISEVGRLCLERLALSRYQGCFVDSLGTTGINLGSVSALPIDPMTGDVYTRSRWLSATSALAAQVGSATAPAPVFINGLSNGVGYFDPSGPSSQLLDGVKGGMIEAFVRPPTSAVDAYESEGAWRQEVDMLVDICHRSTGHVAVAITKVWTTATSEQIDAWHRFALGTFFLGYERRHAYFTFRADHLLSEPFKSWNTRVGKPSGAYFQTGALYVRDFSHGKVVVNPTTDVASMDLGGSFIDLDGIVSSSVTLLPHTATILREV